MLFGASQNHNPQLEKSPETFRAFHFKGLKSNYPLQKRNFVWQNVGSYPFAHSHGRGKSSTNERGYWRDPFSTSRIVGRVDKITCLVGMFQYGASSKRIHGVNL